MVMAVQAVSRMQRAPKKPMKKLQWSKINEREINQNPNAIWAILRSSSGHIPVDYDHLEEQFAQRQQEARSEGTAEKSNKVCSCCYFSNDINFHPAEQPTIVSLLDGKRSMAVNIVLKMFRLPVDAVISALESMDAEVFNEERLQALQKILPVPDEEVQMLNAYDGDFNMLGEAEKFVIRMMKVSGYQVRVDTMLLRLQFNSIILDIKPPVDALTDSVDWILNSSQLREIIRNILEMGNFINHGSFAGNAVGFSVCTVYRFILLLIVISRRRHC